MQCTICGYGPRTRSGRKLVKTCGPKCAAARRKLKDANRKGRVDYNAEKSVHVNRGHAASLAVADSLAPAGTLFCSSCQQFVPIEQTNRKSRDRPQCKPCAHESRVKYGEARSVNALVRIARRSSFSRYVSVERKVAIEYRNRCPECGKTNTNCQARLRMLWRRAARVKRSKPRYRLHKRIGEQIRTHLKQRGIEKREAWPAILGYKPDDLVKHIEKQFPPGMSWDDFSNGKAHIDHIRPVRSFDLSDEAQFIECWNLPNLRPLWAQENLKKSGSELYLI